MQGVAYAVVWSTHYYRKHPLESWRVVASAAMSVIALALAWTAVPALGKQWRVQAGVYKDHESI